MSDPIIPGASPAAPVTAVRTGQPAGATGSVLAEGSEESRGQVVGHTRAGPLVRLGATIWLLKGAPRLDPGTTVRVQLGAAAEGGGRSARLLMAGARTLDPPTTVRLVPTEGPPGEGPRPASSTPGVEVAVRFLAPRPSSGGAPFLVRLSALKPDRVARQPPTAASAGTQRPPPTGCASPAATASPGTPRPPAAGITVPQPQGVVVDAGGRPPTAADAGVGARLLDARVVHRDPSGRVWLQAAGRLLEVQTPLALPLGARLRLQLPEGLAWPPARAAGAAADDPVDRSADLGDRLRAAEARGDLARLGLGLPRPDDTLAGRLLRWIAALDAAPGRAAVDADGEAGTARSSAPLPELTRWASESPSAGWRALVLPWADADAGQLRLFLSHASHQDGEDAAAADGEENPPRRAVFETELSRLGRLQLDALCQGRRFALAVRTERPLEPALRAEIRALFGTACELGGLTGRVGFHAHGLLALSDASAGSRHRITV